MNRYVVSEFKAIIPPGMVIMLDEAQYNPRRSSLKVLKKGKYEVVSPIEFKRGEVIGFKGDIRDKVLMSTLAPIKEPEKKDPEKTDAAGSGSDNPLSASNLPA